ncbi:MAG TPA: TonB-dependent receptor, partial [Ideonella sp.]|nr:TonB-dependent receptor [Ideonella sp.]
MPRFRRPLALAGLAGLAWGTAAAQDVVAEVQRIEIIGVTPMPGAGEQRDQIPSNVQTASDRRLRQLQSLNLPDFMGSQLPSVNVNEMQGNPFQMDVNFRGFSASPLLGTPQGLSVFQDGVRINESFGDVVNWDLIPTAALASVTLLPGSNPLFGLNTLGGALSLQTRSGNTHPGTEIELQAGSFGRVSTELTHGRALGEHGHLFIAASTFDEDGWRDFSPSRVRQLFAKAGMHDIGVSWDLALTHGRNRLIGNGPLPESMLAQRREQVYTVPDVTENTMTLLSLNAGLDLGPRHRLSATLYTRDSRAATLNGDLNDDYDPPAVTQSAVENRTYIRQRGEGVAIQSAWTGEEHRFTLGASIDRARSRFSQTQGLGHLDENRAVVPEQAPQVDALISGSSRTESVYLHELFSLQPKLQLTLSGRFNDTRVSTVDEGRITLGLPTTLDGEGRYRKLNPAVGLTWQATPFFTAYGSLSQGNRAPSPIELGCSDPANACVLPNALQSDPPLKQVVSRTFEAGVRGAFESQGRWNASLFRTVNRDDLLFISNGRAAGYFANFGRTRRQGVELSLSQQAAAFSWAASYSYLRATFESPACLVSEANSTAETSAACPGEGEIEVRPGNRLPGLPEHSVKLSVDWQASPAWSLGAQLRACSAQFVRGNENNAHHPDGDEFNGAGRIGGFAVVDITSSWKPWEGFEIFGKLSNLFDRRYASAGLLGENAFDASGALQAPADWRAEQFVGP